MDMEDISLHELGIDLLPKFFLQVCNKPQTEKTVVVPYTPSSLVNLYKVIQ